MAGAVALVALPLFALLPRTSSKPASEDDCNDSIKNCRRPRQAGHRDKCWCFSCKGDTPPAVCTQNEHDKLALFEAEASRLGTDVDFNEFPQYMRRRFAVLGIIPGDSLNDNQIWYGNANANNGNGNAANMNARNMNGNGNSYGNANMNSGAHPPYNSNSVMRSGNRNQ